MIHGDYIKNPIGKNFWQTLSTQLSKECPELLEHFEYLNEDEPVYGLEIEYATQEVDVMGRGDNCEILASIGRDICGDRSFPRDHWLTNDDGISELSTKLTALYWHWISLKSV